jgi:hypothetical protein
VGIVVVVVPLGAPSEMCGGGVVGGTLGGLVGVLVLATLGGGAGSAWSVSMRLGGVCGDAYGRKMSVIVRMAAWRSWGWWANGVEGTGF